MFAAENFSRLQPRTSTDCASERLAHLNPSQAMVDSIPLQTWLSEAANRISRPIQGLIEPWEYSTLPFKDL